MNRSARFSPGKAVIETRFDRGYQMNPISSTWCVMRLGPYDGETQLVLCDDNDWQAKQDGRIGEGDYDRALEIFESAVNMLRALHGVSAERR